MAEQALLDRLKRYSKKCLKERTDGDFAEAVWEAVEVIDGLLNDLQEALDRIAELTDTNVGKWIPVTERLPELRMWESGALASSNVLFRTADKTINIGYVMEDFHYDDNGCFKIDRWFMLGGHRIENVTHWMPLPEPPKEEKDG